MFVCVSVCAIACNFLSMCLSAPSRAVSFQGLSLALRSHDQFQSLLLTWPTPPSLYSIIMGCVMCVTIHYCPWLCYMYLPWGISCFSRGTGHTAPYCHSILFPHYVGDPLHSIQSVQFVQTRRLLSTLLSHCVQ